jgi:XrtJ-associated TM-motif-TM protein
MKKSMIVLLGCAVMVLVAVPLHAQTGCGDSPENPTVVLALVGGAGAAFSTLRTRLRARRGRSKQ